MPSTAALANLFDRPSLWRIEAAEALGVEGDDLIAAMSPGPAFPAALRSITSALPPLPTSIVDLGAGTGGVSEWLRAATGATVYAIEPARGARAAAMVAFPHLHVLEGRADDAPLASGIADAVTMSGVISLMSDLGSVLEEVDRLLAPSGCVAIADLFSSGTTSWCSAPNIFRSVEDLTKTLHHHGFSPISFGCGKAIPDPRWCAVAQSVDDWIHDRCHGRAGYREWNVDRQHVRNHVQSGRLIGAYVVAARRACADTAGGSSRAGRGTVSA